MSQKISEKLLKTEFKGFLGIDRSSYFGEDGCDLIQNFRIDASGALIKRPGRECIASLSAPVYSVLGVPLNIPSMNIDADLLIAAPPYLYAFDSESGDAVLLGNVSDEHVGLVEFSGEVYLSDTVGLRVLDTESGEMCSISPYAPLYGKGWHPLTGGEIFEAPNLLCGYLRINYKVEEATERLELGLSALSVSRIEINGEPYDGFSLNNTYISGSFPENSEVDVWFKVSFPQSGIFSCRGLCVVGGGADERLVAFDSAFKPSLVFCSEGVSDEDVRRSRLGFADSGALYFPQNMALDIQGKNVSAVCSCTDGFMIFTEDRAFLALPKDGKIEIFTVSRGIGCISPRAVLSKGKSVYTFSESGIYRFDVDLSEPYDTSFKKLSSVLEGGTDLVIDKSCAIFENPEDNEIWFSCAGTVFIYNLKHERFYSYTEMSLSAGYPAMSGFTVFEDASVWRFSDELYMDMNFGSESTIYSTIRTRWLDFGEGTKKKRALTVHPVFKADGGGQTILAVETDNGYAKVQPVYSDESHRPNHRSVRAAHCRFNSVRFTISSYNDSRPTIFGAVLTAKVT